MCPVVSETFVLIGTFVSGVFKSDFGRRTWVDRPNGYSCFYSCKRKSRVVLDLRVVYYKFYVSYFRF